jgi:CBS domain-containing membrane protein
MTRPAILKFLGIEANRVSHTEKLISAAGGFAGILLTIVVCTYFLEIDQAILIIPSMGASAVLLFAVPHSAMAQPWSLVGGHLVSAFIGVSCALLIPSPALAAAAAIGFAIGAMYYARCIHPPGGATALAAVIGGSSVSTLGYQFLLTPVLINVLAILLVAVLFNAFFRWRRYPAYWSMEVDLPIQARDDGYEPIEHADLVYALSQIDSFIDVSEEDLLRIYDLATGRHTRAAWQAGEARDDASR